MGVYINGLEILSEPCKNALKQVIGKNEKVLYCVASRRKKPSVLERDRVYQSVNGFRNWLDGLVLLEERMIFFHGPKYGFVVLGNIEKQPLTYHSIDYRDVTSVSIEGLPAANIYFTVNGISMIMPRESENELRELENWLRKTVREKSQQVTIRSDVTEVDHKDIIQKLEKLAELHRNGSLTDEEYAALKKKIIAE